MIRMYDVYSFIWYVTCHFAAQHRLLRVKPILWLSKVHVWTKPMTLGTTAFSCAFIAGIWDMLWCPVQVTSAKRLTLLIPSSFSSFSLDHTEYRVWYISLLDLIGFDRTTESWLNCRILYWFRITGTVLGKLNDLLAFASNSATGLLLFRVPVARLWPSEHPSHLYGGQ